MLADKFSFCGAGASLIDIDGCLDLITEIEDERMISDEEAIIGRQAILRGDPELTRLLRDR